MTTSTFALRGGAALRACILSALALSLFAAPVRAEVARFAEVEGFARLLDGDPHSVMLSEDGAIGLRPATKTRFADPAMKFGAAGTFGDDVVVATLGNDAALVAIDEKGHARPLYKLGDALVTRLTEIAAAKNHRAGLWAAVSEKGKATLLWWPREELNSIDVAGTVQDRPGTLSRTEIPARFVWDVQPDGEGGAYLATGEPGAVMHVDAKKRVRSLFTPQEAHIKTLWHDPKLGLFAGGGERGIVYHAADARPSVLGKMRALFDTGHQEVTGLRSDGERLFVISVSGPPAAADADARPSKAPDVHSALHRVQMDGGAEVMAASNDELLFDLAFDEEQRLLVATGATSKTEPRGRLYRVETIRKNLSLIYQSPSRRLVRLLPLPRKTVVVEQDGTRLTTLSHGVQSEGCYLSPVVDAGVMAQFGLVQAFGDLPRGSRAQISLRTGQTSEVDDSWSAFSSPVDAPTNVALKAPNARFAQMKVLLRGDHQAQPSIYKMRLAYLRQNLAPFIQEIFALPIGQALYALTPGATGEDGHSRIVSLAGKAEEAEGAVGPRKVPTRARQVAEPGAMTLRWMVDEPNGDELEYTLSVRGPGEKQFRTVAENFTEPFHTFHSAQLADGWYTFRVRASDARSNPAALAKSDERESRAILVDNQPPVFRHLRAEMKQGKVVITGSVHDRFSPLLVLQSSLDGAALRPVMPEDGLLDGLKETFSIPMPNLAPGTHTITVWAKDEADNVGHASVQFAVQASSH